MFGPGERDKSVIDGVCLCNECGVKYQAVNTGHVHCSHVSEGTKNRVPHITAMVLRLI